MSEQKRTKAQEATQAIERIYITMRHLFNRGFYKPMGVSGTTLREGLLELQPEIYGTIAEEKVELNGLVYVLDRLPQGIEECAVINLTGDEGYSLSQIAPIIPPKRRRNCYRIDSSQMNIEITRGRSDIYDVLTHLTFLFIESHKIANRVVINDEGDLTREWKLLEQTILKKKITKEELEVALVHTANMLGRTFEEVLNIYNDLKTPQHPHRFLKTMYWLGKLAIEEVLDREKRLIMFSPILRERLGHHIHGERWANNVKSLLEEKDLLDRPIHIISANMHSVMNFLYAKQTLKKDGKKINKKNTFEMLSQPENGKQRETIKNLALKKGMIYYNDTSGTNIDVQIFDLSKVELKESFLSAKNQVSVIIVMDYAFGEQAYETMDELLKPFKKAKNGPKKLDIRSVSIMGKAGILSGGKGDLMIPSAHIFEGTADNYPFENILSASDFKGEGLEIFDGPMITVLGTSLQNKEMLKYFKKSTWGVSGLEMEGAHYQKAIQAASKIRNSISKNVKLAYAYYASDNPLETGSTLASGGLGLTGVKPTYLITEKILEKIIA
tara:strand:+ start:70251 stop:71915 length:1665 start_codon:yes stop_codon:yes gene_type:complete